HAALADQGFDRRREPLHRLEATGALGARKEVLFHALGLFWRELAERVGRERLGRQRSRARPVHAPSSAGSTQSRRRWSALCRITRTVPSLSASDRAIAGASSS